MFECTILLTFFIGIGLSSGGVIKEMDTGSQWSSNSNIKYFDKDTEYTDVRVTRAIATKDCISIVASSGAQQNVTCCCDVTDVDQSVHWYVDSEVVKDKNGQTLVSNFTQTTNVTCHVPLTNCSSTIIGKQTCVEIGSHSNGVAVFLIILFLSIFVVCSSFFIKRNKDGVYVALRDTFAKNNGKDGMMYDAFISTGRGDTNKLVEELLRDTLGRKCGYNLLVDDSNMLPQLDYNPKVQANIHKCRRLVVIFSATYLTHDWCMYCMGEGLRKIVELKMPTIFVITEYNILRELRAFTDIIGDIPQILLSHDQPRKEREKSVDRIRRLMPAVPKNYAKSKGMRTPILSDVEDTHKRSDANLNSQNGKDLQTKEIEYTFPDTSDEDAEEFVDSIEAGDEINPNSIQVRQFRDRKDLYTLTVMDDME